MTLFEDCTELARFVRGEADPASFSHREHVRMGFDLLRRYDFVETALCYSRALSAMTAKIGKPERFHQTTTIAFLSLIAERLEAFEGADFESFAQSNPHLFDRRVLTRIYRPERLASASARRTFLLPTPDTSLTS
jgi:hypothetical protein